MDPPHEIDPVTQERVKDDRVPSRKRPLEQAERPSKLAPLYPRRSLPGDLPREEPRPKFPCLLIRSDHPKRVVKYMKEAIEIGFEQYELQHDPESNQAQTPYAVS